MRLVPAVTTIAEGQLGLVTRRRLLEQGISPNTIDAAVRRCFLRRVERGVYRIAGAPSTPHSRLLAKVLSAGQDAIASHQTAAWLWDRSRPQGGTTSWSPTTAEPAPPTSWYTNPGTSIWWSQVVFTASR